MKWQPVCIKNMKKQYTRPEYCIVLLSSAEAHLFYIPRVKTESEGKLSRNRNNHAFCLDPLPVRRMQWEGGRGGEGRGGEVIKESTLLPVHTHTMPAG